MEERNQSQTNPAAPVRLLIQSCSALPRKIAFYSEKARLPSNFILSIYRRNLATSNGQMRRFNETQFPRDFHNRGQGKLKQKTLIGRKINEPQCNSNIFPVPVKVAASQIFSRFAFVAFSSFDAAYRSESTKSHIAIAFSCSARSGSFVWQTEHHNWICRRARPFSPQGGGFEVLRRGIINCESHFSYELKLRSQLTAEW